jgi:hypothetical protein
MMKVLTSNIDHQLDRVYEDWQDTFGFGPCGAYAALRREQGWGEVAACVARAEDGTEFSHYVIIQDGDIIDLANPLGEPLTYHELDILDNDELPDLVDETEVAWLRERLS